MPEVYRRLRYTLSVCLSFSLSAALFLPLFFNPWLLPLVHIKPCTSHKHTHTKCVDERPRSRVALWTVAEEHRWIFPLCRLYYIHIYKYCISNAACRCYEALCSIESYRFFNANFLFAHRTKRSGALHVRGDANISFFCFVSCFLFFVFWFSRIGSSWF